VPTNSLPRFLPSATQVAVNVRDQIPATLEILQAGVAPASVTLLTRSVQPLTGDSNVLASLPVIAGRDAASPSAASMGRTSVAATTLCAAQVTIIVDNLAATSPSIEGCRAPPPISLLAARLKQIPIRTDIATGLLIVARRNASTPLWRRHRKLDSHCPRLQRVGGHSVAGKQVMVAW